MKDKIIHTRINDELHDKILEQCNELGCSFSDYFTSVLESNVDGSNEAVSEPMEFPIFDLVLDHGNIYDSKGTHIGRLRGLNLSLWSKS